MSTPASPLERSNSKKPVKSTSMPTSKDTKSRPGGGRGAAAIPRQTHPDKPRVVASGAVTELQSKPSSKNIKRSGGGRRAMAAPTRSSADKMRAIEAAEASLSTKTSVKPMGGGRHPIVASMESKRAKMKVIEEKFGNGSNRPSRRPNSPSSSRRSSTDLYNLQLPPNGDSMQPFHKVELSSIRPIPAHPTRARTKPSNLSLSSLSSFTAFVPSTLAHTTPQGVIPPSDQANTRDVGSTPTPYVFQVDGVQKYPLPPNPELFKHMNGDADLPNCDYDGVSPSGDPGTTGDGDGDPRLSAAQFPVTVSVTTSSSTTFSPDDAMSKLASNLTSSVDAFVPPDQKSGPNVHVPRRRRIVFSSSIISAAPQPSDGTAFAAYNGVAQVAELWEEEDGWEKGVELRRREMKQGWIGEWVISGEIVCDMQEVIRQLRALR
jgi:hypothetical protein